VTPLTETEIRTSFVNLSKGEARRANLPADLDERRWEDLDYLGWRDPKAPARAYLVTVLDGVRRGIGLRLAEVRPGRRKTMCDLCLTVGAATLMVAPRAGKAGQQGNTVGSYLCVDLDCSLFVRNKRSNGTVVMEERLSVEQKVDRLVANLGTFVGRITA
jgi:hypothetical protein